MYVCTVGLFFIKAFANQVNVNKLRSAFGVGLAVLNIFDWSSTLAFYFTIFKNL